MKDARVRGSVPRVGLPAKLVDRGGHGKWVAWCRPGLILQTGTLGRTRRRRSRTGGGSSGEVCAVTGWSQDNARRRLVSAARLPPGRRRSEPRARARKYSHDALKVLQRVWTASGGQCGKIPQGVHAAAAGPAGGGR